MEAGKPLVLITGMGGNIGSALAQALADDYHPIGLDRRPRAGAFESIAMDLGDPASVGEALAEVRTRHGTRIAAVVHLAAYFDFTGEDSPLYDKVNVQGTRLLLEALQDFDVERFIYSSTMLVQEPGEPGARIDEGGSLAPKWAYPRSKAAAEEVIRRHHGRIPYLILRLAGLYDEQTSVPTLAHQIARIYERDLQGHLYAGDPRAGQAFIHRQDMMDLFERAVERRHGLPRECVILAGEEETLSYDDLQDAIGRLIHGQRDWETFALPTPLAKAGAWLQEKAEPVVPDAFDHGEKPFIRPFMIDLASDHYALDTSRARRLLGWRARHRVRDVLPAMIARLQQDPLAWYQANRLTPPDWLLATGAGAGAEALRRHYETEFRAEHRRYLWAPFLTMGLGLWLLGSPAALGYEAFGMVVSDLVCGVLVLVLGFLSLSWRLAMLRWASAAIGCWLLLAPLVFHVPTAAAYLNGTLVGALLIGFAVCLPPTPGISPVAALEGPDVPHGWAFSPSSWVQRIPIIALAFIGFFISRHLAAYQLGHIDGVWDPFFTGAIPADGKNGSEEIVTSSLSQAWPVPDAGLGALTYMLEILTGLVGSARRWRTLPWLVLLFGIMIVPLGAVSITFIIIQPILLDTWCALCLIAAAAMLVQIPYSFDELVATSVFLWRRKRAGRPLLRILFTGDTGEGEPGRPRGEDDFERGPVPLLRDMVTGGVSLPWTLLLCMVIGVWLMCTRLTLGMEGAMANAEHLVGALVLTVSVTACAEVARVVRLLNIPLGLGLIAAPFLFAAPYPEAVLDMLLGVALIVLSLPRGRIAQSYGEWDRFIR